MNSIIGENEPNNLFLKTVEKSSNEYSQTENAVIKEYYKNIENIFKDEKSITNRLSYTLQFAYQIYNKNKNISRVFEKISLGPWGKVYDLLFYSLIVCFKCLKKQNYKKF